MVRTSLPAISGGQHRPQREVRALFGRGQAVLRITQGRNLFRGQHDLLGELLDRRATRLLLILVQRKRFEQHTGRRAHMGAEEFGELGADDEHVRIVPVPRTAARGQWCGDAHLLDHAQEVPRNELVDRDRR
ncbi:hypothetical protein [Nocardia miyunensis]|uniref:hypothetical protein n=1 Tax=Nocardia miyunensis TaxID=282684 RepID=UPI00082F8592|nr:hypothetical protein [Nocardia miyunensis]